MVMNFAERLQSLRKGMGLSQENLAEAVGVSRQAVSKWESGQSYPEMDKLIALSELFGVSIDSMVKDDVNSIENANQLPNPDNYLTSLKSRFHYEYKSKKTIGNVPLVHVNIGLGVYVAKGILAIGNISIGCISLGLVALGGICVGALAVGVISLAAFALGLLFAAGGISIGTIAVGGVAIGIFAIGGLCIGMFSLGGCSIASHIAIGGYANGHIAIGDTVKGAKTLEMENHSLSSIKAEQVRALINQEYPYLWKPITDFITSIFN
jgi:transcriptional regulator with XRE-family HTH domain